MVELLVQAVHVEEALLDENGDVDFARARGVAYARGVVRERPTYNFRVEDLRRAIQHQLISGDNKMEGI